MPNFRAGQFGTGQMTGRGMGPCGRGLGPGRGAGMGAGRGLGMGRGFQNAPIGAGYDAYPQTTGDATDISALKDKVDMLSNAIAEIMTKISKISKTN